MGEAQDKAHLIYLTYNSAADVEHLPRLVGAAGADLPVRAVDNASTDASVERLFALGLQPHVMETNEGFTTGINFALEGCDAEWAVIANPDVRAMESNWLPRLLDVPEDCGIVGARLVDGLQVMGGGYLLDLPVPLSRPLPTDVPGGQVLCETVLGWSRVTQAMGGLADFTEPREVVWVAFALCAIRMKMLREIGLLDERYWHYASDHEYGLRAWAKDWKVMFQPVSFAHHGGTALGFAPPEVVQKAQDDIHRWCWAEPEHLRAAKWA